MWMDSLSLLLIQDWFHLKRNKKVTHWKTHWRLSQCSNSLNLNLPYPSQKIWLVTTSFIIFLIRKNFIKYILIMVSPLSTSHMLLFMNVWCIRKPRHMQGRMQFVMVQENRQFEKQGILTLLTATWPCNCRLHTTNVSWPLKETGPVCSLALHSGSQPCITPVPRPQIPLLTSRHQACMQYTYTHREKPLVYTHN